MEEISQVRNSPNPSQPNPTLTQPNLHSDQLLPNPQPTLTQNTSTNLNSAVMQDFKNSKKKIKIVYLRSEEVVWVAM